MCQSTPSSRTDAIKHTGVTMNSRDGAMRSSRYNGSFVQSKWKISAAITGALATLLDASGAAHAQNAPADDGALEVVIVTATRREESIREVPISISAFSEEQMELQGIRSVDDIARLTPGVQFSR